MPSVNDESENNLYGADRTNEFVKFDRVEIVVMSDPRKETKKNRVDDEEEENPTNIGPGITESNEEA